jgi:HlyD family secretion protein
MTATVDFVTGQATNALLVPNTALRFRPSADELAKAGIQSAQWTGRRDSTARSGAQTAQTAQTTQGVRSAGGTAGGSATRARSNAGTLWTLDGSGKLTAVRVRTGLSDGSKTEVQGSALKEGMQVVVGSTSGASTAKTTATTSANPLQPQAPRRGPGGF